MLKLKMLINVLLVLIISLYLNHINNSFAGSCDEKKTNAGVQTVSGSYNYAPGHTCTKDPNMKYDTANSHETIARNGSADLFVTGNNGFFTWSVSGTGFTLETENEPTGPTNTLYADDTACGAATITITGCDGEEVKGYVRCTTGHWVEASVCDGSTASGCSGWWCRSTINGVTIGKNMYFVRWVVCDQSGYPNCCNDPVITNCGHCPEGDVLTEYCGTCRNAGHSCNEDICFSNYLKTLEWRCNE